MFLKFIPVAAEFADIKLTETEIVSNSITVICTNTSAKIENVTLKCLTSSVSVDLFRVGNVQQDPCKMNLRIPRNS